MDITHLFEPVKRIEMPEDMKTRIVRRCRDKCAMPRLYTGRPLLIAAILLLLMAFTAVGAARWGYMQDIKNALGAITGQEYLNAMEEIGVQANLMGDVLTVRAILFNLDAKPYAFCDAFSIGSYQIKDKDGNILCGGGKTETVPLTDGQIDINIVLNGLPTSPHTLVIDSFIGMSKADQPLEISGHWEVIF